MENNNVLLDFYISCLNKVLERGWADEVRYNRDHPSIHTIDRINFFQQYAFCVYVAFFKFKIVNDKWPALTAAYKNWDYEEICSDKQEVEKEAMTVIGNKRKVQSVLRCAEYLAREGWDKYRTSLIQAELPQMLKLLDDLPGIGQAAKYQLAGAIGIDVAKPDVHLLRLASKYGYPATEEGVARFTETVSKLVGERLKVVDYVFWRYSEGSSFHG